MNWKTVIEQAMRTQGLTQQQLAERVGCSQALINAFLHGKRKEPRYSLGLKLVELAKPATQDA